MPSSFNDRVERIKWELEMDPKTPLSTVVTKANEAMRLEPTGTLPDQVDRLLVVMGIALRSDNIGQPRVAPPPLRPPPPETYGGRPPAPRQLYEAVQYQQRQRPQHQYEHKRPPQQQPPPPAHHSYQQRPPSPPPPRHRPMPPSAVMLHLALPRLSGPAQRLWEPEPLQPSHMQRQQQAISWSQPPQPGPRPVPAALAAHHSGTPAHQPPALGHALPSATLTAPPPQTRLSLQAQPPSEAQMQLPSLHVQRPSMPESAAHPQDMPPCLPLQAAPPSPTGHATPPSPTHPHGVAASSTQSLPVADGAHSSANAAALAARARAKAAAAAAAEAEAEAKAAAAAAAAAAAKVRKACLHEPPALLPEAHNTEMHPHQSAADEAAESTAAAQISSTDPPKPVDDGYEASINAATDADATTATAVTVDSHSRPAAADFPRADVSKAITGTGTGTGTGGDGAIPLVATPDDASVTCRRSISSTWLTPAASTFLVEAPPSSVEQLSAAAGPATLDTAFTKALGHDHMALPLGTIAVLKELKVAGLLDQVIRSFAPARLSTTSPLTVPSYRRRTVEAAVKHWSALSYRSSTDPPLTVAFHGDGLLERLTSAEMRGYASTLGVPHRVAILACGGDGVEHLLLRLHLDAYQMRCGLGVRVRSHCLMIGAANLLALTRSLVGMAEGTGVVGAPPALVVQGIQQLVDLLHASAAASEAASFATSPADSTASFIATSSSSSALALQDADEHKARPPTGESTVDGRRPGASSQAEGDTKADGEGDAAEGKSDRVDDGDALASNNSGEGGNEGGEGGNEGGTESCNEGDMERVKEGCKEAWSRPTVYVCTLIHMHGPHRWVREVNELIDATNAAIINGAVQGATVLRVALANEPRFYESDGIHPSSAGYEKLVHQFNTLIPALAVELKAEAKAAQLAQAAVAAAEAAAAEAEAEAAVAAALAAQKALLSTKINFSKAKKETAEAAKAAADEAAEAARIAAIEYRYWSEEVAAARSRAAAEVLQASMRARRARVCGLEVSGASITGAAAAARAHVRAAARSNSNDKQHQERFGLWTRKRCWAASVLQAFVRKRMLKACEPCEHVEDDASPDGECFRCGGTGHWARNCREGRWIDPNVECQAKLRLRAVREQRVGDTGLLVTSIVISTRLYVGPVSTRWPTRLRLKVVEGGFVSASVLLCSVDAEMRAAAGKTRLCRFFDRFGNCNQGEACSHAHGLHELTPEAIQEYLARPPPPSLLPEGREPMRREDLYGQYKTQLCDRWVQSGRCALGGSCSFAHGEMELQDRKRGMSERELFRIEQTSKSRPCRIFIQTGKCPNGASCLFVHGEVERFTGSRGGRGGGDGDGGSGSDNGPPCLCLKPFSGCRLWPIASDGSHAVRRGQGSGVSDCTMTLLGNLSQFCATFYHVNSWEAGVKLCLHWPADETGAQLWPSRLSRNP